MTNVTTSTSTAADRCVGFPVELKAQKLCVIYLFFRQWTGTATMQRADYTIGKDGYLPPEEVTANYGQKRVIDPIHLRVFDTLKKRAETLLADHGLPFCKGVVLPVDKAPEILSGLRDIADEYNQARDSLASTLDEKCREWIARNPEFAEQIRAAQPNAGSVAQKINADFAVFRFVPAEAEIDKTDSLKRTVDGLFGEVIEDVAKRSRLLHKRSVSGKCADDLSQRTLSTLKVMKEKLNGLRFLNGGVTPIIDLIDRLLALMPTRGKFTADQFNALNASLGVLCSEQLLIEVATGKLTLNAHLASVLPALAQTSTVETAQSQKSIAHEPAVEPDAVSPSSKEEAKQPELTLDPVPAENSVENAASDKTSPVCEEAFEAPQAQQTAVSKIETTEKTDKSGQTDGEDLEMLNRMLEMCFEDASSETDSQGPAVQEIADIPPAPAQIQLSAF